MATDTRNKIVNAAFEALRTRGFAGASARNIAALAGVNPGLIFYYFGSVDELLLAALRETSEARLERHRAAAAAVGTAGELVTLLRRIYREDAESGQVRVVCEMVAGSVARPELGREVMALMEPWVALAELAVERVLGDSPVAAIASPHELALAAVTFYLGANLLAHLQGESEAIDGLLAAGERAAGLLDLLNPGGAAPES
ncbi:MAG: TetR/AcrR family transcriptional regulator [Solirubrobacteraceae bacterium]